jgi:1,4-alpha-glucan branching enzyme
MCADFTTPDGGTLACGAPDSGAPDWGAIEAIAQARHGDPFAVLGPHALAGGTAIRAFVPDAASIEVLARESGLPIGALTRVHQAGFWSGIVEAGEPYRLRIRRGEFVWETEDAYSFPPLLGEMDIYLLAEGRHRDFARVLGAHVAEIDGVAGVRFAVWAPNARRVSVVGSFNNWDGRRHPMGLRHGAGMWELFIPRAAAGDIYKYEIMGPSGEVLPLKADPVAQATERPPATGSVVPDPAVPVWHDEEWMQHRGARQQADAPMSIYEMHAMSWLPNSENGNFSWDDLGEKLIPYVQQMGFTHVELMPVMEHPFGGSWGYQPLGQFAPTARLGAPLGFARFVDRCHAAGVGVILDWVPAHFPTDAHGLARFDGTPLYEHADPREGFHRDWNTLIYNHGRNEVRAFLIGSALHWLEHYHVDALRVDAVASMLYRDYSRPEGEWVPNQYGGRENLEAIGFFHELSRAMMQRVPGAVMIAEESTAFPKVSRPVDEAGLGFHYKWNMGWMHDTLQYMEEQPVYRRWHHGEITFGLVYAFSENFVLPLSHDEVVYGKGSLIRKMPGDDWQRFANLRAYFGFMWTHPGKKLVFMGGEIAQWREWNHDAGLDWFSLDNPLNKGVQTLLRDLNAVYRHMRALHVRDCDPAGFAWVVMDDAEQSVYAYLRLGNADDAPVLVVCNFTPVPRLGYRIGVPRGGAWRELVNTDSAMYGGSNMGNGGQVEADITASHGQPASLVLTLPPLATLILSPA